MFCASYNSWGKESKSKINFYRVSREKKSYWNINWVWTRQLNFYVFVVSYLKLRILPLTDYWCHEVITMNIGRYWQFFSKYSYHIIDHFIPPPATEGYEKVTFSACLSVHRGVYLWSCPGSSWADPIQVLFRVRGGIPWSCPSLVPWVLSNCQTRSRGSPPPDKTRGNPPSPPPDSTRVWFSTLRAACYLRSCRRTFFLINWPKHFKE